MRREVRVPPSTGQAGLRSTPGHPAIGRWFPVGERACKKSKMYYVYILKNPDGSHYIGYTADLPRRIKGHNSSKSRWTWSKGPWHLVYKEEYETKKEAFLRERQIKRYKGGEAFRKLLAKKMKE